MKIKSLGLRTDIMFFKFQNNVIEKQDYIVITTPENPTFFWGNMLIYPKKLNVDCFERWNKDFKKEFHHIKEIEHITFAWEEAGDIQEIKKFIDNGFEYNESLILISNKNKIKLMFQNNHIVCRRITTEIQWKNLIEFQVLNNTDFRVEEYHSFIQKRFKNYRNLSKAGHGHWYGAYLNGKLVSDLGLFWEEGLARFQNIKTISEFRKRGISQTLINFAVHDSGCSNFVIEAEEDGPALNMYKSIGFELKEKIYSMCRYNKEKWDS